MKSPKIIWLQWEEHDFYNDGEVITWCKDKINDSDVEYIRKDVYDKLKKELDKYRVYILIEKEIRDNSI